MSSRAAARSGQSIHHHAIVSNFDAGLRVVAAGPGVNITLRQTAKRCEMMYGV
jgi:hypothetical protein